MRQILRKSRLPMSPSVPRFTPSPVRAIRRASRMVVAVSVAAATVSAAAGAQQASSVLHHTGGKASARAAAPAATPVLLDAMTSELHRAFVALGKGDDKDKRVPPYFLSYSVS